VVAALSEALVAEGLTPTALVNLADASAVAMLEKAGFVQHASYLRLTGVGRR
jgi:predicted GNAT family acetyltransferase